MIGVAGARGGHAAARPRTTGSPRRSAAATGRLIRRSPQPGFAGALRCARDRARSPADRQGAPRASRQQRRSGARAGVPNGRARRSGRRAALGQRGDQRALHDQPGCGAHASGPDGCWLHGATRPRRASRRMLSCHPWARHDSHRRRFTYSCSCDTRTLRPWTGGTPACLLRRGLARGPARAGRPATRLARAAPAGWGGARSPTSPAARARRRSPGPSARRSPAARPRRRPPR